MQEPEPTPSIRSDVIRQMLDDAEAQALRPLSHYVAQAPHCANDIAEEHSALQGTLAGPTITRWIPQWTEIPCPGSHLGPFRLEALVGRGGQGAVFRACDTRVSKRIVALKVLELGGFADPMAKARLQREADLASQIEHRGICRIYDIQMEHDPAYIAMEFVEGQTLRDFLRERRRTEVPPSEDATSSPLNAPTAASPPDTPELRTLVSLAADITDAVQAAHDRGIIHRDLKPGNIIIRPDGTPVVLDFGLARGTGADLETLTASGHVMGTPAYMSPEQTRESPHTLTETTDVWSLGVILFECFTLSAPFAGATPETLYEKIRDEPHRNPRDANAAIARDLRVIIDTSLEKLPRHRYQSAQALGEDLRRWLDGEPILARPAGALRHAAAWARRHRAAAIAAATIVLALLVALAVSLHALGRARDGETAAREETLRAQRFAALAGFSSTQSARLRGDMERVLEFSSNLDHLETRDRIHLTIYRLEALDRLGRAEEARALLASLTRRQDLGSHAARVQLLMGDLYVDRFKNPDAGLDLVAKAAATGQLADGNQSYAEALLATSVPEARRLLEHCLARNPDHLWAREHLGTLLLASSDYRALEDHIAAFKVIFPADDITRLFDTTLLLGGQDPERAEASLRTLHDSLRPRYGAAISALAKIGILQDPIVDQASMDMTFSPFPAVRLQQLRNARPSLAPFLGARLFDLTPDLEAQDTTEIPLRIPPSVARALRDLSNIAPHLLGFRHGSTPSPANLEALQKLEALVAHSPIPVALHLLFPAYLAQGKHREGARLLDRIATQTNGRFLPKTIATWGVAVWGKVAKDTPDTEAALQKRVNILRALSMTQWTPDDYARLTGRCYQFKANSEGAIFWNLWRQVSPKDPRLLLFQALLQEDTTPNPEDLVKQFLDSKPKDRALKKLAERWLEQRKKSE